MLIATIAVTLCLCGFDVKASDSTYTGSVSDVDLSATTVERPARPENTQPGRFKVSEVQQLVKKFDAQKKEFLRKQQELQEESRRKARAQINSGGGTSVVKLEAKDSIEEAKTVAREQARKLNEEAKEAAKEDRKRR